jgi:hypothetical protein
MTTTKRTKAKAAAPKKENRRIRPRGPGGEAARAEEGGDDRRAAELGREVLHRDWRPGQEALGYIMAGRSPGVMPTAAASRFYQLPSLVLPGLTVVSPLIALIKDQVDKIVKGVAGASTRR